MRRLTAGIVLVFCMFLGGCVVLRELNTVIARDVGVDLGLGQVGLDEQSSSGSISSMKSDIVKPNELDDGAVFTSLRVTRGSVKAYDNHDVVVTSDGGGNRDAEDYTRWSQAHLGFEPTVSAPIFLSVDVTGMETEDNATIMANLLGGLRLSYGYHKQQDYAWALGDQRDVSRKDISTDITDGSFDNLTIYQNARTAYLFMNSSFLSSYTFSKSDEIAPGRVELLQYHAPFEKDALRYTNYYLATGKAAWGFKEALVNSIKTRASGRNPYVDQFDIRLSGGLNKGKVRTTVNKNEVAEARISYQTMDINATITPKLPPDTVYPVYINVTYEFVIMTHLESDHYILGKQTEDWEYTKSRDKQYVVPSPASVITDTFSVEYLESGVNSDFTRTWKRNVISDPEVDVSVTGLAILPAAKR
jgi:hypothetical protein